MGKEKTETVVEIVETHEEKVKRLEIELLELQKLERQYSIKDLKSRITERDLKEMQTQQNREAQGRTFAQDEATDAYAWKICTHKKGGTASGRDMRVLKTGGNSNQYAVLKHQMINGDIWVRCLRCSKTWTPPVKENFYFSKGKVVAPADGVFDAVKFEQAELEYMRACNFETNNSMSGSVQCRFTEFDPQSGKMVDAAETYRLNVSSSNLR